MFDIITFGSATQDLILKPKNVTHLHYEKSPSQKEVCFPMGSKIDISDIQFNSGGGGTNTAATFSLQGFKTAFCGVVGRDVSGQEIINELEAFNINTSLVVKTSEKRTNHSIVILGDGTDRTILAYRGAAELMAEKDIPYRKLKTRWIYLAPLSGLLCDNFEAIINFAHEKKIKIAANPSMAQLSLPNFQDIAQKIDVLFLNQEEASFLTKTSALVPAGTSVRPSTQIKDLSALVPNDEAIFKKIDQMCPGVAVMTKGGEGVVVSDGKHLYSAQPPADRKVVDTTGAGDSFASGFLSDYIRENGDIEKAIQLGMANSVGCLSQVGAKNGLLKKGQNFEKVSVQKEMCNNDVCMVK